jgi:heme oxygenase
VLAGLLRRFKDDTRELHLLAEHQVRILDADATVTDYRDYLRAMYGFHAPIEEIFSADTILDGHGFTAHARRKAPLLLRDLRALGLYTPPVWCTALPDASTLARRLGIAYVLEGSTLGGRYILSKLPSSMGEVPIAFLAGYGHATGPNWKRFAAIAERLLVTRAAEDDAVRAAQETFERLIDWLAQHARVRAAS